MSASGVSPKWVKAEDVERKRKRKKERREKQALKTMASFVSK